MGLSNKEQHQSGVMEIQITYDPWSFWWTKSLPRASCVLVQSDAHWYECRYSQSLIDACAQLNLRQLQIPGQFMDDRTTGVTKRVEAAVSGHSFDSRAINGRIQHA